MNLKKMTGEITKGTGTNFALILLIKKAFMQSLQKIYYFCMTCGLCHVESKKKIKAAV